jgi:general secretion pathway protein H
LSPRRRLGPARWRHETPPSGKDTPDTAVSGFTLLETVCVVAIVAMLAGLALPAIPLGTSRSKLEAYAVAAAAVLKSDRNAAMRRGSRVTTTVDPRARLVQSGASARAVRLPGDVGFEVVLAEQCAGRATGDTIDFFPSGMSCGGTLLLSRLGTTFEVRVTWLTGGVEIVRPAAS